MADPAQRRATYADLKAVPPHLVAEIIHGALVTHPRPTPRHAGATFALGSRIGPGYQMELAVRAAGCSSASPNSTLAAMSSFPILPDGGASG